MISIPYQVIYCAGSCTCADQVNPDRQLPPGWILLQVGIHLVRYFCSGACLEEYVHALNTESMAAGEPPVVNGHPVFEAVDQQMATRRAPYAGEARQGGTL